VEEDDLLEYAQTFLKTYEDIIKASNLAHDDLESFHFYQSYPYSVNATISNIRGASITFIPNSIDKNKVTRVTYPIEELIPIINNDELNSTPGISINGNSSDMSAIGNTFAGYFSSISDMENYSHNSNNKSLYPLTNNASIILDEGASFNGFTYIVSNKVFRKGELIINGTLVLNDSKVIMKNDLKKDWTKEKAEGDVIDCIYKKLIDEVFDYSKLTGIGFREIGPLVTEYNEKQMAGYYEINEPYKWRDRQKIFDTAKKYGISNESVLVELLEKKQEKTSLDKIISYMEQFNTVFSFIAGITVIFSWNKRETIKEMYQKLKKYH
jgi:hypothetical protein